MKLAFVLISTLFTAQLASAQQIKVLVDNEWVKVSRVIDQPGYRRGSHSHKDTVVLALSDHRRRVVGEKPVELDIKAGQAMWFVDVTHSEENIGKAKGELLIVEVKKRSSPEAEAAKWPDSLDAVAAAPGNHRVVLENERVRVLDVTVRPGENEPLHMHRMPSVLYIIAEDDIQDFDAAGKLLYDSRSQKEPPKTPYAEWMPPQAPHRVVNRSKNALRLFRIEVK